MRWSEEAWEVSGAVYRRILEAEFIRELMAGTLAKEKFIFYIRQDAVYLESFSRALAGIAAKLEAAEDKLAFLGFANEAIQVEGALHASYLGREAARERLAPSPSCLLYTSYLMRQLFEAPLEVAMAAVLPCFRVYKEVGEYILDACNTSENPYKDWIAAYGNEDFALSVSRAEAICDAMAAACSPARREAMTGTYLTCVRMEWMFWNSAWRMESWPV